MTPDEIKILVEKVKSDLSTPEEELALLEYLNNGLEELRAFIKELMVEEKKSEVMSKLTS